MSDQNFSKEEFMCQCSKLCNEALTIEDANKILDKTQFVNRCIKDCEMSESFDMIELHRSSYLSQYQANVESLAEVDTLTDKAE